MLVLPLGVFFPPCLTLAPIKLYHLSIPHKAHLVQKSLSWTLYCPLPFPHLPPKLKKRKNPNNKIKQQNTPVILRLYILFSYYWSTYSIVFCFKILSLLRWKGPGLFLHCHFPRAWHMGTELSNYLLTKWIVSGINNKH